MPTYRRCGRSPPGCAATWTPWVAGLTLEYNSGTVEGTVRIKQLKTAMYGRAKPDLLRELILLV